MRHTESGTKPGESVTVKPLFAEDKSDTWKWDMLLPEPEAC